MNRQTSFNKQNRIERHCFIIFFLPCCAGDKLREFGGLLAARTERMAQHVAFTPMAPAQRLPSSRCLSAARQSRAIIFTIEDAVDIMSFLSTSACRLFDSVKLRHLKRRLKECGRVGYEVKDLFDGEAGAGHRQEQRRGASKRLSENTSSK